MKSPFTVTASAIALAIASPAAAAEAQVETIEVAPSEAKIALAREAVDIMWPVGNAEYTVDYLVGPYADRMLDTPVSQLAREFGIKETMLAFAEMMPMLAEGLGGMDDEEDGSGANPLDDMDDMNPEQMNAMADMFLAMLGDKSIRDMVLAEDEHFDERVTIFRDVLGEDLPTIAAAFEGPLRDGLAQVFAKKFSEAELAQLAAFADTPTGRKFARNYITIGFEPEYYGGMLRAIPRVVPAFLPLVEKMESRMAHLPPMFPEPVYCVDVPEGETVEDCIEDEPADEMSADERSESAAELEEEAAELEAVAAELRAEAAALRAADTD